MPTAEIARVLPTLLDRLRAHAVESSDVSAVIDGDTVLDYPELLDRARRVAGALIGAGVVVGAGDRVLYLGVDSHRVYELLYGCALTESVLVPVNWRLSDPEVADIAGRCGAQVIIADDPERMLASPARIIPTADFDAWRDAAESPAATAEPTPDTPIVQMYTSGTTGRPKGVVLAHRTFTAVRDLMDAAGVDWIDWHPGDRSLAGMSAFHIGGMWWAAQALNAGVTSVVVPVFGPAAALAAIRDHGITTTCMAPAMIRAILDEADTPPDADIGTGTGDFATLRKVVYGGSPIDAGLLQRAIEIMDCDFAQIYGLTETGNTAVCLPPDAHRGERPALHATGRPYPGVRVQIRRSDGVPLPDGETGEVYLATPAHMVGYHEDAAATADRLADGWIRTGDAGYVDADGYLVIHDRVDDMILVGAENVYPAEVEKVINAHPGVWDCAVIGVPDDIWGESVLAYVVPRTSGLQPGDVARFLRGRLAAFKSPMRYRLVTEIPRNVSGKVLRRELRDTYAAGRGGAIR
ncbi:fatty acid--CoA ligase [Gordonia sinesedis]